EGTGARTLAASYIADESHRLSVDVETAFDGRFFPDYAMNIGLIVDAVPPTWSFETNLATSFVSNASTDEIDAITVQGDIYSKLATGDGAGVTYGANSLEDPGQSFAENSLSGGVIFSRTQMAAISDNTATQVNLAAGWPDVVPPSGAPYVI